MRTAAYGLLIASTLVAALTIAHYPSVTDSVSAENPFLDRDDYRAFYKELYSASDGSTRAPSIAGRTDDDVAAGYWYVLPITEFVRQFRLSRARVLEVGAGRGKLQDIVADYTGLDIAPDARRFFHKPFVAASATSIPFKDGEFDAVWTINVLEHVPKPEQALSEMRRVIKDNGILYLQVAWQCRSWAAEGYQVRTYGDFDLKGMLVKATIPIRDSVVYRALYTFPIRSMRLATSLASGKPTVFRYNTLQPNYKTSWQSDSDAVNSMDPYEAALWFTSRGDELLLYDGLVDPFFVRSGPLVIRIRKPVT